MLTQRCRLIEGCHAKSSVCGILQKANPVYVFNVCTGVKRAFGRQRLGPCRRQLARRPAATPSPAPVNPKAPSSIVRSFRELAKAKPVARDRASRADLDTHIDGLANQFRSGTADGTHANSRDLGVVVWALAKLSTPCCLGHAVVLLHALTSGSPSSSAPLPSASLQSASNQTICKALYAAALLAREFSKATRPPDRQGIGFNGSIAPTGQGHDRPHPPAHPSPQPTCCWSALLPPARALAAACVPRLGSFNMQDMSSAWWAIGTLAGLPLPPSPPLPHPTSAVPKLPAGGVAEVATSGATAASPRSPSMPHRHQEQTQKHQKQNHGHEQRTTSRPQELQQQQQEEEDEERGDGSVGRRAFLPPEGLLAGLAAAAARQMRTPEECSTQGVANMLWGACRLRYADERMLAGAVALMTPQVRVLVSADPRAFATCVWALASLRYPKGAELMAAASRPVAAHIRSFDDQSLSNLLWAYGTLGVAAPRLFAAAADEVARRADRVSHQFLANCMWAFATVNHLQPQMMAAVAEALTTRRRNCYAGMEEKDKEGEGEKAERAEKRPARGSGRGDAMAEAALAERLAAYEGRPTQTIGNLAWSFAALGARHDPLINALARRAAVAASALNAQELSNVLYGIARLTPYMADTQPDVLEALMREVDRRLELACPNKPTSHQNNKNGSFYHPKGGPNRNRTSPCAQLAPPPGQPRADKDIISTSPSPSLSPSTLPPSGQSSSINAGAAHLLLTPRDLAMVAWSLAILKPGSLTLIRVLAAAVAAATASAGTATASLTTSTSVTERDATPSVTAVATGVGGGNGHYGGSKLEEELDAQPYNLFGLVQLYGANYAACLAAAAAVPASPDGSDVVGRDLQQLQVQELLLLPSVTEDGGDGAGGSNGGGVGALVRAAAAVMRQAQRAAEAIGGEPIVVGRGGTGAVVAATDVAATTPAVAAATGEGKGGEAATPPPPKVMGEKRGTAESIAGAATGSEREREKIVLFGPLGACPAFFRACRDAWFLNTASTKPSELQAEVVAILRNRGGGDAGEVRRRVVAVAEEALSPDRMLRVDLLVQYGECLVLLEVDGPSHFAVELCGEGYAEGRGGGSGEEEGYSGSDDAGVDGDDSQVEASCREDADTDGAALSAAGRGRGRQQRDAAPRQQHPRGRRRGRLLRRLGDTLLRDRFLAASLGPTTATTGVSRDRETAEAAGSAFTTQCTAADPWVIRGLLEQLSSRPSGPSQAAGRGHEANGEEAIGSGSASSIGNVNERSVRDCEGNRRGAGVVTDGGDSSGGITAANIRRTDASETHGGGGVSWTSLNAAATSSVCASATGGDEDSVFSVSFATLDFSEWNVATGGAREKWSKCLEPLLARVCTTKTSN